MTPAQKKLVALGWSIAHTQPLHQSFHFERFVAGRRVATIILRAKSTAKAWTLLGKMLDAPPVPPRDETRLGRELALLEATNPAVARAARKYDEMVRNILAKKESGS